MSPSWRPAAALGGACGAAIVLGLGGCQHSTPAVDEILARSHGFVVTASDVARWAPVLERDRAFRRTTRGQVDLQAAMVRQIALTRIALEQGDELISNQRRAVVTRDVADRAVRRLFDGEILLPQITVSADQARRIFTEHRDGYRKAPGVRSLEIFCWAPIDLAELRAEKRQLLDGLRASIHSIESFEEAAWRHSDATSAVSSGHIGTLLQDQVGEPLRSALFNSEPGVTEVIESPDGLFLFYVVGFTPAKDNRFEDVADGIVERLTREGLDRLRQEAVNRALQGFEMADPPPTDLWSIAARVSGRDLNLMDLELEVVDPARVRARIVADAFREQLEARSIVIPDPPPEEIDWRLYREVWPILVERWRTAHGGAPEPCHMRDRTNQIERWWFDLLVISHCSTQHELFQTFRSLYELGPGVDLGDLASHLESQWGLETKVRRFEGVTAAEAAPLGPEIHTTLKRRLEAGQISKPMHITDRDQVVVAMLTAREVDPVASADAARRQVSRHALREAERELEDHLLEGVGFEYLWGRR